MLYLGRKHWWIHERTGRTACLSSEVRLTTLVKTCYSIFFLLKISKAVTAARLAVVRSRRRCDIGGLIHAWVDGDF